MRSSFTCRSLAPLLVILCTALLAHAQMMGGWFFPPPVPIPTDTEFANGSIPPPPTTSILSEPEQKLVAALDQPRNWAVDQVTVSELAELLNEWFPCDVDVQALDDVGLSADVVVGSLHAKQLATRDALRHLLTDRDLAWTFADRRLVLTTPEEAEDQLRLLVLPVGDLIGQPSVGEIGYDYDSLIHLMTSIIRPSAWGDGNWGPECFAGALIFEQSWEIGEQIELLFETLRGVKRNETAPDQIALPWYGFHFDADAEPEFDQRVTLDLNTTLDTLIEKLNATATIQTCIDRLALDDVGLDGNLKVRFSANNEPLLAALCRTLRPHDLTVAYDYPFLLISNELGRKPTVTRIYPIHDLVDDPGPSNDGLMNWHMAAGPADHIVTIILSEIDHRSWDNVGGEGAIESFPSPCVLVVNQSLENHRRITDLLTRMRRVRQIEHRPSKQPDLPHVAIYRLKKGIPVEKTIQLLRELVPAAKQDRREADRHTYLEPFGQGILVCHSEAVHHRIRNLLSSLDLAPRPPASQSGMGGGFE